MLNKYPLVFLILHAMLGIVLYFDRNLGIIWLAFILVGGVWNIISSRNNKHQAVMWAAYLAGAEVLLRMTRTSFFWEMGKYGIILFLVLGLFFSSKRLSITFIIFFLLLMPSIAMLNLSDFAEARDMISFNLSGPLCLAVSAIYFSNVAMTGKLITSLVRCFAFPVISILIYLFFKTPDIADITFRSSSNFAASGGFGPNQVSLILGFAISLIVVLNFYGISLSGIRILDYIILALLLFRAFVTFSRGGVIGAGLGISTLFIIFLLYNPQRLNFRYIILMLTTVGILFYVWNFTNQVTKSSLTYRYKAIDAKTGKERDITTGRELLFMKELDLFRENKAFGVGPGMAVKFHERQFGQIVASHSEYSRLISEHGVFGVLALIIMILAPITHILQSNKMIRPLLAALLVVSLFAMLHSAMRLGAIGFLYGWAFLFLPMYSNNGTRKSMLKTKHVTVY